MKNYLSVHSFSSEESVTSNDIENEDTNGYLAKEFLKIFGTTLGECDKFAELFEQQQKDL